MSSMEALFEIPVSTYILGFFIPLLIYWYLTRNHDYWKKRNVPFVTPYPFIGSVEFFRNSDVVEIENYNKYGRIYGFFEGNIPAISVGDPKFVKKILVEDFHYFHSRRVKNSGDPTVDNSLNNLHGEKWKRFRKMCTPTFTTGKLKKMMIVMEDGAQNLVNNFRHFCKRDGSVDVINAYGNITLDIRASVLFSTKLNLHRDPGNEFDKHASAIFNPKIDLRLILTMIMPSILRKLGFKTVNADHLTFFKQVILEIIEKRRKTQQPMGDFLQLLLESKQNVSEAEKLEEKLNGILSSQDTAQDSAKNLSTDEIVSQSLLFLLAGYHTGSVCIGIAMYNLALHEDVQEKVFEEIQDVLKETDGELTYESLQKLKYLDNVISETVRINPPGLWLLRMANADYELGDTGIKIPKGMIVKIPKLSMHMDPDFFPEPEKFDPDRFSQEQKEKIVPYTYYPFGIGPRNCLGMRFSMTEIKICLTYIISAFKIRKCPDTKVPLEMRNLQHTLVPKSLKLFMEPRTTKNPLKKKL